MNNPTQQPPTMPDVIWANTLRNDLRQPTGNWFGYDTSKHGFTSYTRTDLIPERAKLAAERYFKDGKCYSWEIQELTAIIIEAMKGVMRE